MKKTLLFLASVVIAFNCLATTNLIINPGFENGTNNWNAWDGSAADTSKPHTGSRSLHSQGRGFCTLVATQSQSISVSRNTYYKYSGWIFRTDDSSWAYIDMNDAPGELQLRSEKFGQWDYVSGIWNSGNNTSVSIRCVVERNWGTGSQVTGDIWFDDLEFSEYQEGAYSEDATVLSKSAIYKNMSNSNTEVQIAIDQNKLYISELNAADDTYKWISGAYQLPMLSKISGKAVSWKYNKLTENGSLITVDFYSDNLILSVNFKLDEEGPLHIWQTLKNNSASDVSVGVEDIVASDIQVNAPESAVLWRFNRSRYNNGLDGNFTTGVLKNSIGTNYFQMCQVENSWLVSTGELPMQMIQSGNKGIYYALDWNFGIIKTQTQNNSKHIRLSANLGLSGEQVVCKSGNELDIPGSFIGVYKGTTDDGANQLKRWFWKNEAPATLRDNENEPLIEIHFNVYDENGIKYYLNRYNLPEYGVGLIKMDYWWCVASSSEFDSDLETKWNPYPSKWPNGMTFGTLTKSKYPNVKNSLYMCDTYLGADIANESARNAQIEALATRIQNWKIDYWRSDFDLEKANNFASHQGLLYILDELTSRFSNFRYEHCSAGGSLKDFTTLRRMTFMTMEDSGGPLNHRMAFYPNSYMINPVQLKFDVGYDWTSPEDAGNISSHPREWAKYVLRSSMMGAMMACAVGRDMSDVEFDEAKKAWKLYNEKQRAILRGANVYHILPMPDGNHWDGMEFFNPDTNKGSVFLFSHKAGGGADGTSKTIYLQGLNPTDVYKVTFQDRTNLSCQRSGSELMTNGIKVTGFSDTFATEIIWIEGITTDVDGAEADNANSISVWPNPVQAGKKVHLTSKDGTETVLTAPSVAGVYLYSPDNKSESVKIIVR
ncbi:MAG: GH36 C-terminal domain-containing protein [Paludibacteraceae bacterium]|nr:GH36 C-terminal domain-containing protein [Paludibacteraceae bacterium]